jgi:hypothetical protein
MTGIEYKPYVIDTGYLLPPSLADFLGTEDEVHVFREVTEYLDISHLDSDLNGMGQHPYHPLMLLRLLMWGMANSVCGQRKWDSVGLKVTNTLEAIVLLPDGSIVVLSSQ